MSTDPNPWTALVEALQRIERECVVCPCGAEQASSVASSALASWESRPRLDDDVDLVAHITVDVAPNVSLPDVRAVLAAVEVRLFGAPGKGTT